MSDIDHILADIEAIEINLTESVKDLFSDYQGRVPDIETASSYIMTLSVYVAALSTAVKNLATSVKNQT